MYSLFPPPSFFSMLVFPVKISVLLSFFSKLNPNYHCSYRYRRFQKSTQLNVSTVSGLNSTSVHPGAKASCSNGKMRHMYSISRMLLLEVYYVHDDLYLTASKQLEYLVPDCATCNSRRPNHYFCKPVAPYFIN